MNLHIVPHDVQDFEFKSVLQLRHVVKRLELPEEHNAECAIFLDGRVCYATETPQSAANLVNSERLKYGLLDLAELTLPGGKTVWFAGEHASGPIRLLAEELMDGIHSAFKVGSLVTRVRNSPDEVAKAIHDAGGHVLDR